MNSRPMRIVVAVGACAVLTAGCGGAGADRDARADEAPPDTPVPELEVIGDVHATRVGVLAIRSAVAANAQYGPVVEYLQQELDRPFELVPLGQDELFEAVAEDAVDFVMTNPLSAVQLRRLHDTRFLATLTRADTGTEFGGLIIVRPDSDIERPEDLRGRAVTCVAFDTAAAGCNFQIMHLRELGITPDEFATFTETPSQDNIVLAVLNGDVDAGFIRTGQLERMLNDGTLMSLDELRIIDRQDSRFFYPHTTRLYPEWPMASLASTDDALATQVADALLALEAAEPALAESGVIGFVPPPDYGPLDRLVVELQLRSWDAPNA